VQPGAAPCRPSQCRRRKLASLNAKVSFSEAGGRAFEYGILGRAMETSASFEARSAPLLQPTSPARRLRPERRSFLARDLRDGSDLWPALLHERRRRIPGGLVPIVRGHRHVPDLCDPRQRLMVLLSRKRALASVHVAGAQSRVRRVEETFSGELCGRGRESASRGSAAYISTRGPDDSGAALPERTYRYSFSVGIVQFVRRFRGGQTMPLNPVRSSKNTAERIQDLLRAGYALDPRS